MSRRCSDADAAMNKKVAPLSWRHRGTAEPAGLLRRLAIFRMQDQFGLVVGRHPIPFLQVIALLLLDAGAVLGEPGIGALGALHPFALVVPFLELGTLQVVLV